MTYRMGNKGTKGKSRKYEMLKYKWVTARNKNCHSTPSTYISAPGNVKRSKRLRNFRKFGRKLGVRIKIDLFFAELVNPLPRKCARENYPTQLGHGKTLGYRGCAYLNKCPNFSRRFSNAISVFYRKMFKHLKQIKSLSECADGI